MRVLHILLILPVTVFTMMSCSGENNLAEGYIELTYDFNAPKTIEPSFQTVIWLENAQGKYIKSLLVSEYLSFGGYEDTLICPDWNGLVDWENMSDEEYDAITAATPPVGSNTFKIDCSKEKLLPDEYRVCIQTHIRDEYNILYCGKIEIGKNAQEGKVKRIYIPNLLPETENVLTNVFLKYYN